ncbi:succinyl-CoA synthetase beta subunit [Gregarina niphandrodes]|uniref:Succinate--CoA ligase [ADP-forming] subunit beta, mitochondrial n=1 Tax=Gregarina niphandrodes TaxID=110365 RepID=A0A023B5N1_GRENI|nr:succinyl-CoA synthetase beta subunit [Gregarina niphandrodes]EZG61413.1 succinyl-CoA synthetase beta subunit [Gregarina niphandrodes]|eukprot:XP_011130773.1 succinyl-CoA synthetase beta subunit [Gregarina niphandrodes]
MVLCKTGVRFGACPGRGLALHEYQAKALMDKYGLPTQMGLTADSSAEAGQSAKALLSKGAGTVVLKAQVFAGGRGKGSLSSGLKGGVQFVKSPERAAELASQMLGHRLTTHQTPAEGLEVRKLLLTEAVDIAREFYLAIILDRTQGGPCIVCSREGGVDIEEVAKTKPEAIRVIPVNIAKGVGVRELAAVCETLLPTVESALPASAAGLSDRQKKAVYRSLCAQLQDTVKKLYQLFEKSDASQIEINPIAVTGDDRVVCVDAKLGFDDNAFFRQKELFAQEDTSVRCPRELAAEAEHMNYVSMDGNVGCLVNGAGLAMATMDLLTVHGGSPANFLDLGGGATKEQVLKSFELLTSDPKVQAIFVNIFGGITRCDVVAQGILEAAQLCNMDRPLIVRLAGNNAEKAKQILSNPPKGLNIHYVQDFSNAAKTAVEIANRPQRLPYTLTA